jgi:hypothetical protein
LAKKEAGVFLSTGTSSAELDAVGEGAFKKQLWLCMAGMALKVKAEVEHYRSRNIFGLLVWQLNEVRACMRPDRIVIFLYAALRCTALCCAVLCCAALRCAVLCCT